MQYERTTRQNRDEIGGARGQARRNLPSDTQNVSDYEMDRDHYDSLVCVTADWARVCYSVVPLVSGSWGGQHAWAVASASTEQACVK